MGFCAMGLTQRLTTPQMIFRPGIYWYFSLSVRVYQIIGVLVKSISVHLYSQLYSTMYWYMFVGFKFPG